MEKIDAWRHRLVECVYEYMINKPGLACICKTKLASMARINK
jgi:hypothetical protein